MYICICSSAEIAPENLEEDALEAAGDDLSTTRRIYGVVGILPLVLDQYIIVISGREQVTGCYSYDFPRRTIFI